MKHATALIVATTVVIVFLVWATLITITLLAMELADTSS